MSRRMCEVGQDSSTHNMYVNWYVDSCIQGVQTMSRDAQNLGKKDALQHAVKMMKCESAIFKNVKRKRSSTQDEF